MRELRCLDARRIWICDDALLAPDTSCGSAAIPQLCRFGGMWPMSPTAITLIVPLGCTRIIVRLACATEKRSHACVSTPRAFVTRNRMTLPCATITSFLSTIAAGVNRPAKTESRIVAQASSSLAASPLASVRVGGVHSFKSADCCNGTSVNISWMTAAVSLARANALDVIESKCTGIARNRAAISRAWAIPSGVKPGPAPEAASAFRL